MKFSFVRRSAIMKMFVQFLFFFVVVFTLKVSAVEPTIMACVDKQEGEACESLRCMRCQDLLPFKGLCKKSKEDPGLLTCQPSCVAPRNPRTGHAPLPVYCKCNNECQVRTAPDQKVGFGGQCAQEFCSVLCARYGGWNTKDFPSWNHVSHNLPTCGVYPEKS